MLECLILSLKSRKTTCLEMKHGFMVMTLKQRHNGSLSKTAENTIASTAKKCMRIIKQYEGFVNIWPSKHNSSWVLLNKLSARILLDCFLLPSRHFSMTTTWRIWKICNCNAPVYILQLIQHFLAKQH